MNLKRGESVYASGIGGYIAKVPQGTTLMGYERTLRAFRPGPCWALRAARAKNVRWIARERKRVKRASMRRAKIDRKLRSCE